MTTEPQWDSPKPSASRSVVQSNQVARERDEVMQVLRQHPGRWARISEHASPGAARVTKRRLRDRYPDHEFCTETRDGKGLVFARFPEPEADA